MSELIPRRVEGAHVVAPVEALLVLRALWPDRNRSRTTMADWLACHDLADEIRAVQVQARLL